MLPRQFFALELSAGAFRVLAYLWTFAGQGDRFVWPSRDRITSDTHLSDRTLRRGLGELERLGLAIPDRALRGGVVRDGWRLATPDEAGVHIAEALQAAPSEGDDAANPVQSRPTLAAAGQDCPPDGEQDPSSSRVDAARFVQTRPTLAADSGQLCPDAANLDQTRPTLAADGGQLCPDAANFGRSTFIDQPINHSLSFPEHRDPSAAEGSEVERESWMTEFNRLSAWRDRGGDPEGLGPWRPPVLHGVTLQRLALDVQIRDRLAEGRTAVELHRAAHQLAEAVSQGVIDPQEWRAPRVWSRWLDELLVRAAKGAARAAPAPAESQQDEPPGLTPDRIDELASAFLGPRPGATPQPTPGHEAPDLAEAPRLEEPETTITGLQSIAASWSRCRECGRQCTGSLGLHRHVQASHGIDAWTYYQRWPIALLLRALDESDLEASPVAHFAGPCWVHRGVPDRWGARLRVAGAPTSALYRLTWWAVVGTLPVFYACHVCDNPRCCNPLHVWDGSPKENAADRDAKGRHVARRRALSDEQIAAAVVARGHGKSWRTIAAELDVDDETLRRTVLDATQPPASACGDTLGRFAEALGDADAIPF